MVVQKKVRKTKNARQIKQGKIGKLEQKRRKILELKQQKKQEIKGRRGAKKDQQAVEAKETVDTDGFFVLPNEFELDDRDEAILQQFGESSSLEGVNDFSTMMAELDAQIDQKTDEAKEEEMMADPARNLKVKTVYQDVGLFLSKYRSGKLPKPLKVLPMVRNCFQILDITSPLKWTNHAYFEVTNSFSNSMPVDQFRIFLNKYLLPAVLRNIARHKKLNYHLYSALKRALYKPAAFFRGIIFPVCQTKEITLKTASVIASVIATKSVPFMHSSIAMLKLAQMQYSGPSNVMLFALINKKYSLPRSVMREIFKWAMSFEHVSVKLPVLWFKTVLVFVENYCKYFDAEQAENMKRLVTKAHKHHLISKEIVRKLKGRGQSLNVTLVEDSRMIFE